MAHRNVGSMMFAPLTDLSPSDSTLLSISGQLISQLPGIAFVKTNTSVYVESNEYSAYLSIVSLPRD